MPEAWAQQENGDDGAVSSPTDFKCPSVSLKTWVQQELCCPEGDIRAVSRFDVCGGGQWWWWSVVMEAGVSCASAEERRDPLLV